MLRTSLGQSCLYSGPTAAVLKFSLELGYCAAKCVFARAKGFLCEVMGTPIHAMACGQEADSFYCEGSQ